MMKQAFSSFVVFISILVIVQSKCNKGCDWALASFYYWGPEVQNDITPLHNETNEWKWLSFLGNNIELVPFPCHCIDEDFLGYVSHYQIQDGDTYSYIAQMRYDNLTTSSWIERFNSYDPNSLPIGGILNVTVNCSCRDSNLSNDSVLLITFPLQPGYSLSSIVRLSNVSASLLESYNPGVNFSAGTGLIYIPWQVENGLFHNLTSGSRTNASTNTGLSPHVIAGVVAAVLGLVVFSVCWYLGHTRKKKAKEALRSVKLGQSRAVTIIPRIIVDTSAKFSYQELAYATNNFSMANKIGEGGFGAVYHAELRGEKAAIKKMDMHATKEFLAELKVLSCVHHSNLVHLIGYCVQRSLFLVYEYVENSTLRDHLHGSGETVLPWMIRVQIALDSARGLEYIHEHTIPIYIHRDIKSANILLDNNFHAKVADFGLTKLAEVGNSTLPTAHAGTFGYMPPEYAQLGKVSPKVDVYAFGVVLFELISAKAAVVHEDGSWLQPVSLVTLFHEVLSEPDPNSICKLVDPRLGNDYPLDSVLKMAELGKACTDKNPELRPSMRYVVVALSSLSSFLDDL